jgi:hypothetical protein
MTIKPRSILDLRGPTEVAAWEATARRTQELWANKSARPEFALEDKSWMTRLQGRFKTCYGSR